MSYSVLTYGPHTINVHNRDYPEVPVTTLAWADTSDVALSVLARLARRPAAPEAYRAAAQVECVLTELNRWLTGHEGRPVIVTAGVRTAHPPTRDAASQIIPCIYRNDWRVAMDDLRDRHAGIAFGAIHDTGIPDELWRFLGNDVGTALDDFSAPDFALALGLTVGYAQLPAAASDRRATGRRVYGVISPVLPAPGTRCRLTCLRTGSLRWRSTAVANVESERSSSAAVTGRTCMST